MGGWLPPSSNQPVDADEWEDVSNSATGQLLTPDDTALAECEVAPFTLFLAGPPLPPESLEIQIMNVESRFGVRGFELHVFLAQLDSDGRVSHMGPKVRSERFNAIRRGWVHRHPRLLLLAAVRNAFLEKHQVRVHCCSKRMPCRRVSSD
jgi:hypothetical protein